MLNIKVDPNYMLFLTDGEVNNLVYLTLKYTVGWQMRECDLQVIQAMQPSSLQGVKEIDKLVKDTCEYAWDHLAGEPDKFSPNDLYNHIKPILEEWYANTTRAQRANTE